MIVSPASKMQASFFSLIHLISGLITGRTIILYLNFLEGSWIEQSQVVVSSAPCVLENAWLNGHRDFGSSLSFSSLLLISVPVFGRLSFSFFPHCFCKYQIGKPTYKELILNFCYLNWYLNKHYWLHRLSLSSQRQ